MRWALSLCAFLPVRPPVDSEPSPPASRLRVLIASRKVNPLLWAVLVQSLLILATLWILVFRAPEAEVVFLPVDTAQVQPQALKRQSLFMQMTRSGSDAALHSLAAAEPSLAVPAVLTGTDRTFTQKVDAFSPFADGFALSHSYGMSAAEAASGGAVESLTALLEVSAPVSFFGIKERAARYVILLDTSNSMFVRSRAGTRYVYDFGQIKEETCRLLEGFNANTLFNIIVYEGGAWAWQEHLQVASGAVREQAQAWVRGIGENPSLWIKDRKGEGPLLQEGGGTRLDTALKLAFAHYDPEVVFIVTDGEINSIPGGRITEERIVGLIRSLRAEQTQPARIHVVHFQTAQMRDVELQTLRAIAQEGRGRFTAVTASER